MKAHDTTLKYYAFSVHFNPFLPHTAWDKISEKAKKYFVDFLNEKDYGDVLPITFNFFVEQEIDFDKQFDNISIASYFGVSKNARLNLHFDYDYFTNASEDIKYNMVLNGILYLLEYWYNNLKIPKRILLKEIIDDYKSKLIEDAFFMETIAEKFIKFKNQFRFNFVKHHFYGIKEKHIFFKTNDIEKHLNNNLYKYDFGKSITQLFFSYDIFDFENKNHQQYIDNEKEYGYGKYKDLTIIEQYDSNILYTNVDSELGFIEAKKDQLKYFHKGILAAIERIEQMKRKPKDFNVHLFYEVIDKLLNEYEQNI